MFAGYVTDPATGGSRVSRGDIVRDGWLNTGDLGSIDADGFVYLTGRAKDLIIRGGHNIDPRVIEDGLLSHPAVTAAAAVGRPDRHSGEVPVAYVVPADPARFDEAELLAWAATAIGEPAARPKRIYPIEAIPVTAIGKHYKPALAADAAARAAADALTDAGLPGARVTASQENGRPVVTVTGAEPGRAHDALAGFPSPPARCLNGAANRPNRREGTTTMNDQHPSARADTGSETASSSSAPARSAAPRPSCSPTKAFPSPCWNATPSPIRCRAPSTSMTKSPGPCTASASARNSWPGPAPAAGCACSTPTTTSWPSSAASTRSASTASRRRTCSTSPTWKTCCSPGLARHPLIDFHRGAEVTGLDGTFGPLAGNPG